MLALRQTQATPNIVWSSPSVNERYTPGDALVVKWKLQSGQISTSGLGFRVCASVPMSTADSSGVSQTPAKELAIESEYSKGELPVKDEGKAATHSHQRPSGGRKRDISCAAPMFPKVERSADGIEFSTIVVVPPDLPVSSIQSYYVQLEDGNTNTYASPGFAYGSNASDASSPGSSQTQPAPPNTPQTPSQPSTGQTPAAPPLNSPQKPAWNELGQPVAPAAQQPLANGQFQPAPVSPQQAPQAPLANGQSQPAPVNPASGFQQPFVNEQGQLVPPLSPASIQYPPGYGPLPSTIVAFLPTASPPSQSGNASNSSTDGGPVSPVVWAVPLAVAVVIILASLLLASRYRRQNNPQPQLRPLHLADPEKAQNATGIHGGFDYGIGNTKGDIAPVLPSLPQIPPALFISQLSRQRTAHSVESTRSSGTSVASLAAPPGLTPPNSRPDATRDTVAPPAPPPKDVIPSSLLPAIPTRIHTRSPAVPIVPVFRGETQTGASIKSTGEVAASNGGSSYSGDSLSSSVNAANSDAQPPMESAEVLPSTTTTSGYTSSSGDGGVLDAYAEVRAAIERRKTPISK